MPDSPVIDDSSEFVPMPTPDRVVTQGEADKLDPIPFQFNDIRALAQRILKRAQEQGQQKLEAARKQISQMEKQAQDKGYKEGFPKGQQEGFAKGEQEGKTAAHTEMLAELENERQKMRESVEQTRSALEQLAAIMNENCQQLIAQAEGDLLLLALDLAKRLVGHELSVDPEAIRPLAIEAIGLVTDRSAITARVNPDDYKVMEETIPDLNAIFPDIGSVQIETDPSVERGGLIATTREAEVDMRLATRLATFEEAILGYSGKAAEAPWSAISPEQIAVYQHERAAVNHGAPQDAPTQSADSEKPAPAHESHEQTETAPEPIAAEPVSESPTENTSGDQGGSEGEAEISTESPSPDIANGSEPQEATPSPAPLSNAPSDAAPSEGEA